MVCKFSIICSLRANAKLHTNYCRTYVRARHVRSLLQYPCGFDGEILIDENLEWYCPNCGNRDHKTLNVARRTCGYIGSQFWNKGRTQEIKERVLHIDNKDACGCGCDS